MVDRAVAAAVVMVLFVVAVIVVVIVVVAVVLTSECTSFMWMALSILKSPYPLDLFDAVAISDQVGRVRTLSVPEFRLSRVL